MQLKRDGLSDPGTADTTAPRRGTGTRGAPTCVRGRRLSPRTEFEPFRIDVHHERETVRVTPVGELDLATVAPLRERLDEVRASGCRSIVLDLRELTFIDSSGLHLTLSCDRHARESQIEFAIIQGPPAVRRVFEITGLLNRLSFRPMGDEDGPRSGPPPVRLDRMPAEPHRRGDPQNESIGARSESFGA